MFKYNSLVSSNSHLINIPPARINIDIHPPLFNCIAIQYSISLYPHKLCYIFVINVAMNHTKLNRVQRYLLLNALIMMDADRVILFFRSAIIFLEKLTFFEFSLDIVTLEIKNDALIASPKRLYLKIQKRIDF